MQADILNCEKITTPGNYQITSNKYRRGGRIWKCSQVFQTRRIHKRHLFSAFHDAASYASKAINGWWRYCQHLTLPNGHNSGYQEVTEEQGDQGTLAE